MSLHQEYEQRLQNVYEFFLKPGDVAIDVGAHSGRHTSPMAKAVSGEYINGLVYAFEPMPNCITNLRHRLKVDKIPEDRVLINQLALSDSEGDVEFVVAVDRPEESGLRERVYNGPTRIEKIPVKMKCLDNIPISNAGSLAFLKIDCEGAELPVLKGGLRTVSTRRPVVGFEFGKSTYTAYGINPLDMFNYFHNMDYVMYDIKGKKLDSVQFVTSCEVGGLWDYVAIPKEKARIAKYAFNQDEQP
jgi:FkbM family methyltransferase